MKIADEINGLHENMKDVYWGEDLKSIFNRMVSRAKEEGSKAQKVVNRVETILELIDTGRKLNQYDRNEMRTLLEVYEDLKKVLKEFKTSKPSPNYLNLFKADIKALKPIMNRIQFLRG
jgi:hypothetical protein